MVLNGRKTYRVKLRVLTPVFVGGGDNTMLSRLNYAYVPEEKKVYVLDERKWIGWLTEKRLLNNYQDYLVRQTKQAKQAKQANAFDNYKWLKEKEQRLRLRVPEVLLQVSRAVHSTAEHPDFKTNDIHGFVKNLAGLPYIPGSSLKGALRTAILAALLRKDPAAAGQYRRQLEQTLAGTGNAKYKKDQIKEHGRKLETNLLGYKKTINGESQLFRGMAGLSVSDSAPFAPDSLMLIKKSDLTIANGRLKRGGGRPDTLPLYRECARPGTEVEFTLAIDRFKINKAFGIETLADLLDVMQIQFAALFGQSGVFSPWPGSMDFLPQEALEDNGRGVLILGGGAGFHAKTVVSSLAGEARKANDLTKNLLNLSFWKHKHHQDRPLSPRALKVARVNGKDFFMGLCRLSEAGQC